MAEDPIEAALVVVEPLQTFIVHGPDIHHYIAGIQRCRVSRSDQLCQIGVSVMKRVATGRRGKPASV